MTPSTRNMPPRITIVGIGSAHGDDAIGWRVILELSQHEALPCRLAIVRHPVDLIECMEGVDELHVCDACWGSQPGRIHRWTWPDSALESFGWSGTHDMHVVGALQLAQTLGVAPKVIVVWGIEATRFQAADHLTDTSETAIRVMSQQLRQEVQSALGNVSASPWA
jgi:hydrogenase maturation protease